MKKDIFYIIWKSVLTRSKRVENIFEKLSKRMNITILMMMLLTVIVVTGSHIFIVKNMLVGIVVIIPVILAMIIFGINYAEYIFNKIEGKNSV